ncbi:hypothetical protein EVAR_45997_1 [Eumeta japonica]|uniref:Uncharacterized protein n=1 Tax=Eumeta variegata TaxID=151549 RepID=A0A4C1XB95_EUMVA|nr:hypothetical protein EVAR_45997_1 [Eumeta japonica]
MEQDFINGGVCSLRDPTAEIASAYPLYAGFCTRSRRPSDMKSLQTKRPPASVSCRPSEGRAPLVQTEIESVEAFNENYFMNVNSSRFVSPVTLARVFVKPPAR